MDKVISDSNIKSLKPPPDYKTNKIVDKKKYLDEIYSKEWINNYFKITTNK